MPPKPQGLTPAMVRSWPGPPVPALGFPCAIALIFQPSLWLCHRGTHWHPPSGSANFRTRLRLCALMPIPPALALADHTCPAALTPLDSLSEPAPAVRMTLRLVRTPYRTTGERRLGGAAACAGHRLGGMLPLQGR